MSIIRGVVHTEYMKKHILGLCGLLIIVGCQHSPVAQKNILVADEKFGSLKGDGRADDVEVILIPQWHLSPNENTNPQAKQLPQIPNQLAIYHQLVDWAQKKQINTVIVEGCEGEIKDGFGEKFNGWSLQDLEKSQDLDSAITQIGLKLEAKFGPKLKVLCGDNLVLIKKNQLAFSDIKGLAGFKIRINEYKNQPEKQTEYLGSLRQVLKLPQDTSSEDTLKKLNIELLKSLNEYKSLIKQRNDSFVNAVKDSDKPVAIVIGALHIEDLKDKLNGNQILIFEPTGLKGDETSLVDELEKMLNK